MAGVVNRREKVASSVAIESAPPIVVEVLKVEADEIRLLLNRMRTADAETGGLLRQLDARRVAAVNAEAEMLTAIKLLGERHGITNQGYRYEITEGQFVRVRS